MCIHCTHSSICLLIKSTAQLEEALNRSAFVSNALLPPPHRGLNCQNNKVVVRRDKRGLLCKSFFKITSLFFPSAGITENRILSGSCEPPACFYDACSYYYPHSMVSGKDTHKLSAYSQPVMDSHAICISGNSGLFPPPLCCPDP